MALLSVCTVIYVTRLGGDITEGMRLQDYSKSPNSYELFHKSH